LIEEDLTLASGLFRISGTGGSFAIQRLINGVYISAFILQYNSATGASRLICPAEFRPESIEGLQALTILNTLTARDAIVSTLTVDSNSTSLNANIGNDAGYLTIRDGNQLDTYYQRSQTGVTLFLNRNTRFPVQCGSKMFVGDISGISSDAANYQLAVAGAAIISGGVTTSAVAAETLTITHPSASSNLITTGEIGSGFSYFRFVHGHHLDCYTRGSNSGRTLYLNYYANSGVRITRLGINTDPAADVHLDVRGSGRFTGSLSASNFPSSSDARLKTEIESVDLGECTRLVKAVTPCTYKRRDMEGTPERCGYIAQHWDRELTGGYRCIMGAGEDADGPLLAIDYSRIVPVLHGCLLSCLARIEALESRLT
jgi:hypothetical protein